MSWVTDKATLELLLVGLGYSEIADDENTEDEPYAPHKNFYYKLNVLGADGLGLTSNASAYSNRILLECYYINDETNTRDENYDNFSEVFEAIISLSGFLGEISNDFEDIDELHCKGIINFYFGFETC